MSIDNKTRIILTPINLTQKEHKLTLNGKKARIDYKREQQNFDIDEVKWDDSSKNNGRIGDKFAFVRQSVCIKYFDNICQKNKNMKSN